MTIEFSKEMKQRLAEQLGGSYLGAGGDPLLTLGRVNPLGRVKPLERAPSGAKDEKGRCRVRRQRDDRERERER